MADVSAVIKHFPTADETFSDNLSAGIGAGVTTVPVNSAAPYANGDVVALVVDPGTADEAVFTGTKSGNSFIDVVWTEGNTGASHDLGATVVDYVTATHLNMISKGIKVHANDDGTLKEDAVRTALSLGTESLNGWNPLGDAPDTITYTGNRSYDLVFNGEDHTDVISRGMRLRTTRTVAAPTQSASLNGTSQYFSDTTVSGMTFTDDFVVSAWVKVSSYAEGTIASRYNGTSGWFLHMAASGVIRLRGINAGSANNSEVVTYQSVPLNKWVHITAQLDMSAFTSTSTTSYIMFDGVDVPVSVARGGTNPTSLVQAGNLEIGANNSGVNPFPGKIAQVAVFSAKVTQANIRATISQGLLGTETSLVSAYSFNNSITDLNTTNANNLVANGGAVATNADSPFGVDDDGTPRSTLDYAIVMDKSFSTNTTLTVQVPEGCTIPTSGGVSVVSYAVVKVPYGFPASRNRWFIESRLGTEVNLTHVADAWIGGTTLSISIPTGDWVVSYEIGQKTEHNVAGYRVSYATLSTSSSAEGDAMWNDYQSVGSLNVNTSLRSQQRRTNPLSLSAQTTYYGLVKEISAAVTGRSLLANSKIYAENAYL